MYMCLTEWKKLLARQRNLVDLTKPTFEVGDYRFFGRAPEGHRNQRSFVSKSAPAAVVERKTKKGRWIEGVVDGMRLNNIAQQRWPGIAHRHTG